MRGLAWLAAALGLCAAPVLAQPAGATPADRAVPRFDHIVVIVEENKNYEQIHDPAVAPNIAALAKAYGDATQFFSEVHPSEANYVALLGGDTFGIHDDEAFYCHAGVVDRFCPGAQALGYANHTTQTPSLGQQLEAAGMDWRGYYEDIPAPGSLAVIAANPAWATPELTLPFYASKHSGFLNFAAVQNDPRRAELIVGFDRLDADLKANRLPAFALIVPNQCNEMHGITYSKLPPGCFTGDVPGLIHRGDAVTGDLVRRLMATPAWKSRGNMAIVITFDEGAGKTREGCCAVTPDAPSNFGGGHIPTIVIVNHGPRGLADPTPYNHYSLLRTFEDAFRLDAYLGHAADREKGVLPMTRLFGGAF